MDRPVDSDKRTPAVVRAIEEVREKYEAARLQYSSITDDWMWEEQPMGSKCVHRSYGQEKRIWRIACYALQEEIGHEVITAHDGSMAWVRVPVPAPKPEQILDGAEAAKNKVQTEIRTTWGGYLQQRDQAEKEASEIVAMADTAKEWADWWRAQPHSKAKSREWMRCNRLAKSLANVTPQRKPERADRHELMAAMRAVTEVGGGVKNVAYRDWVIEVDIAQKALRATMDARDEKMVAVDKAEDKMDIIAAKVAGAQQALKYRAMVDDLMEVAA